MTDAALGRDDNLFRYLDKVRGFPMLSEAEELDLARRWRDGRDEAALARLASSHLRMVVKMAMDNRGYGLPVAELISEGNLGLVQAIQKFDPERGFRLSTYARWWIRAAIQDYILRSWSLVKMGTTAAQKKLFFSLRKLKRKLREVEEGDLSPETLTWIATELAVREDEVVQMNRRLAGPDHSLNASPRAAEDGEWQDLLVDEAAVDQETWFAEREELLLRRRMLGAGVIAQIRHGRQMPVRDGNGGIGGFSGIDTFIDIFVAFQSELVAGGWNKLPETECTGLGQGFHLEPAFYEGQPGQLFGHSGFFQPGKDKGSILT